MGICKTHKAIICSNKQILTCACALQSDGVGRQFYPQSWDINGVASRAPKRSHPRPLRQRGCPSAHQRLLALAPGSPPLAPRVPLFSSSTQHPPPPCLVASCSRPVPGQYVAPGWGAATAHLFQSVKLLPVELVEFRVDICRASVTICEERERPSLLTLDGILRPRNDDVLAVCC